MMSNHRRALRNILIDLLLIGVALVVFALFHHVLPRQQQGLGIQITNPYATRAPEDAGAALEEEQPMLLLASTQVSDSGGMLSAASRTRKNTNTRQTGGSQKGGGALTGETDTEPEDDTPIADKFAEMYSDTTVSDEDSYVSQDISISVSEETLYGGRVTYYLADIYLRDVTRLQSVLAGNRYGSGYRDEIDRMARQSSALVAINGDYYGNTNEGVVIRNGMIYRANPTSCDVCVLYYDGSMSVMPGSAFSVQDAIERGAWQAWTFGPSLLDEEGQPLTSFSSTRFIAANNPRTAIGYYEPGHYCMVVVDGRGESAGITLADLSQLFYDLGCRAAYNLDGGNSSIMVWNGDVINQPSGGGRASSDAILITEVN